MEKIGPPHTELPTTFMHEYAYDPKPQDCPLHQQSYELIIYLTGRFDMLEGEQGTFRETWESNSNQLQEIILLYRSRNQELQDLLSGKKIQFFYQQRLYEIGLREQITKAKKDWIQEFAIKPNQDFIDQHTPSED